MVLADLVQVPKIEDPGELNPRARTHLPVACRNSVHRQESVIQADPSLQEGNRAVGSGDGGRF